LKLDLDELGRNVAALAGLGQSQARAFTTLFGLVEKQAFCDGVLAGRSGSYAKDPERLYLDFVAAARKNESRSPDGDKSDGECQAVHSVDDQRASYVPAPLGDAASVNAPQVTEAGSNPADSLQPLRADSQLDDFDLPL